MGLSNCSVIESELVMMHCRYYRKDRAVLQIMSAPLRLSISGVYVDTVVTGPRPSCAIIYNVVN